MCYFKNATDQANCSCIKELFDVDKYFLVGSCKKHKKQKLSDDTKSATGGVLKT